MSTPFREKEPPLPLRLLGVLIEYWDEFCICLMGLLAYPPLSLPVYFCLCCDIL